MKTSACRAMSTTTARPWGLERSTDTDSLPALTRAKYVLWSSRPGSSWYTLWRVSSPSPGRSILMTRAPMSASSRVQYGPARTRVRSSTRNPARGSGESTVIDCSFCRKTAEGAEKGPDARRRPKAAGEAYFLYVEPAAEGANEADGPLSAACTLEVDQLGHPLAMPCGVAEGEFRPLGPLEVEVQVVLPGESDAAVELDAGAGDPAVGVRDIRLRHANRELALRHPLVHGPRGVVRDRLAVLDIHQHIGGLVLDALVGAD